MSSGQKDSRSFGGILYFQNVYFDTLRRFEHFSFDHLVLIQDRIYLTKVHTYILSDITLNHTGNHVFFFCIVLIKQHFALFLTDFLKDDVSCILSCNTSELLGFDLFTDYITEFIFAVNHFSFRQTDFSYIIIRFFHNSLIHIYMEIIGVAVNLHTEVVGISSEMSLTCGN